MSPWLLSKLYQHRWSVYPRLLVGLLSIWAEKEMSAVSTRMSVCAKWTHRHELRAWGILVWGMLERQGTPRKDVPTELIKGWSPKPGKHSFFRCLVRRWNEGEDSLSKCTFLKHFHTSHNTPKVCRDWSTNDVDFCRYTILKMFKHLSFRRARDESITAIYVPQSTHRMMTRAKKKRYFEPEVRSALGHGTTEKSWSLSQSRSPYLIKCFFFCFVIRRVASVGHRWLVHPVPYG